MSKRVYISADYDLKNGDREVVDVLHSWGDDNKHKVDFVDTAEVASGSVSNDDDCRICDLKEEFNKQINASSVVIFVVGDKTASRSAGSECERGSKAQNECKCTPYKQNANGKKDCKITSTRPAPADGDYGCINSVSYLQHEFEEAKKRNKTIIILYNSLNNQVGWLPSYMYDYKDNAHPFWTKNDNNEKVGDYSYIKQVLGYE